jgi:hypothetical protein
MRPLFRFLGLLSVFELLSVAAFFTNLLTVHSSGLASLLGPVHGALYPSMAVTALLGRKLRTRTRLLALVPSIGGAFALIALRSRAAA